MSECDVPNCPAGGCLRCDGPAIDPAEQIRIGHEYAKARYGDAARYERGGYLIPSVTRAFNNTGKPIRIRPAKEEDVD